MLEFAILCKLPEAISQIIEAMIIGTLIKKENLATVSLFSPFINPAQMVEPDLDMPGKIASPWAIPINKEVFVFLLNSSLFKKFKFL